MRATERRCDRCSRTVDHGGEAELGVVVEVKYHHPSRLDLCRDCEGEFTLWLGKHPLWGTPLSQILAGRVMGQGYPSAEQIAVYEAAALPRKEA